MAKDALFEIGMEELPARFVDDAEKQLKDKTKKWLDDLRIGYSSVASYSTPRRLAVLVQDMEEKQTTIEEEAKGPALKIAQDDDGNWTKAAIGFTKGQGKTTEDIYTKDVKGTTYIFVKKHLQGKPTAELLPSFAEIIESLQFPKNMRWANESMRYARPIRWLVALYGSDIIPFEVAHVKTGNQSFGHRFLGDAIILEKPSEYVEKLADNYVIANPEKREKLIIEGIQSIEKKRGISIPVEEDLLNEVRNLVEYPTVFIGSFDESYLNLPSEVLVTSMKEHQRYFPVQTADGNLLPCFVGVRNGDESHLETVVKGNEKVLSARLSDAQFFFEEDQKHSIDFYTNKLNKVVFQEKLGTIQDKVERVIHITEQVAEALAVDDAVKQKAVRAAQISKFDLMTNMVNEFTELQGIMGAKYAIIFGENETVAEAIAEHYMPRHANGELPKTTEGSIVSIADKLDTIVGCISIGLIPTGSQDPYGLRRQAAGVLRILQNKRWNISFESLLEKVVKLYNQSNLEQMDHKTTENELKEFAKLRASFLLKESGIEQDIVEAILENGIGVVGFMMDKARELSEKRNDPGFKSTHEAFTRVLNLAKKAESNNVHSSLFENQSEWNLDQKLKEVSIGYAQAKADMDAALALTKLGELTKEIHAFFEHNMVMADNKDVRDNRLALLNKIAELILDYANVTKIEWKQHF